MIGKKYILITPLLLGFLVIVLTAIPLQGDSSVKVWEESLVIPTYRIGRPDLNPIFYTGRAYQGAKGQVYPYPLLESHHFHVWEGGGRIHNVYVDAHLLRGQEHFAAARYREALKDYVAALDYPENLDEAKNEFKRALELNINHLGAKHHLARLTSMK